jgi:hypothetical protein
VPPLKPLKYTVPPLKPLKDTAPPLNTPAGCLITITRNMYIVCAYPGLTYGTPGAEKVQEDASWFRVEKEQWTGA